jgi:hypothetical protein
MKNAFWSVSDNERLSANQRGSVRNSIPHERKIQDSYRTQSPFTLKVACLCGRRQGIEACLMVGDGRWRMWISEQAPEGNMGWVLLGSTLSMRRENLSEP